MKFQKTVWTVGSMGHWFAHKPFGIAMSIDKEPDTYFWQVKSGVFIFGQGYNDALEEAKTQAQEVFESYVTNQLKMC